MVVGGCGGQRPILRGRLEAEIERNSVSRASRAAAQALCTDNAAMIGAAAARSSALPFPNYLGLNARSV